MILTNFTIPKRHLNCSRGAHPFSPGDKCYTFVSAEPNRWSRQDLCEACWFDLKSQGLPAGIKSHWQTKVQNKESLKPLSKQKEERALDILKEIINKGSPEEEREAFVLALYLARKKLLIFRQEIELLGEVVYLYESVKTEELFSIKKTTLTPSDIENLQIRLSELLAVNV